MLILQRVWSFDGLIIYCVRLVLLSLVRGSFCNFCRILFIFLVLYGLLNNFGGGIYFSDCSLVLCLIALNKWIGRILSRCVYDSNFNFFRNLLSNIDYRTGILLLGRIFGWVDDCFGFHCLIFLHLLLLGGVFDCSGNSHVFLLLLLLLWRRWLWLLSFLDWFHVKLLKYDFLT